MIEDFKGLVGVITGGGDGIGRALAMELAGKGMNLAVLDIRVDAAEEVAGECRAKGVLAVGLKCDVTESADLQAAARAVHAELGAVNLLWVNAGVIVTGGITTARPEDIRWMFAVNVDGALATLQAFVPAMKAQAGWRWVAITSSMAGLTQASPSGPTAYVASKYASVGIAEGLKAELSGDGIGVTLVCPGAVNTRIWDGRRARPDRFGGTEHAPESAGDRHRAIGMDVDDVAKAAVEGLRQGDFYVVLPTGPRGLDRIRERNDALIHPVAT